MADQLRWYKTVSGETVPPAGLAAGDHSSKIHDDTVRDPSSTDSIAYVFADQTWVPPGGWTHTIKSVILSYLESVSIGEITDWVLSVEENFGPSTDP